MRSIVFALPLVFACSKSEPAPPNPAAPAPSAPSSVAAAPPPSASGSPSPALVPAGPKNVLFVTIDSLRTDSFTKEYAPNLYALAERCTTYENAYSVSSYTAKSVAAFLSGYYPSTLYRSGFFFASYGTANDFMAEQLQKSGIATLGWFGHMYFSRAKGLEQGFDEWRTTPGISFDAQTDNHVTGDKMTALGIELLSKPELKTKPFFAWAHYMDPHDQYNRHEEAPKFGNKARDRYAQEIFYTDLWVKKLLDFVDQQPFGKDTYFVLSADHGEAFGEHGMYKHAFELWEVLTRVPLVVCGPGIKAQRIKERRSHIDLVPTFLDLLGQKPAASLPGKSAVPELMGKEPPASREPIYLEMTEDSHNPPRRAIIRGDYKLIWSGPGDKFQLFNLSQDAGEEKDLAKAEPETLKDMVAAYHAFWDKLPMVEPYGNVKLKEGGTARGPTGPKAD
ncbi:MAG: Choline-sulfatase [Polyangiaceae bacterium]|jgi:arylsulfatase A-like enzyme|nr:Choline-sulfatase [Polyangiaceae bacterium]